MATIPASSVRQAFQRTRDSKYLTMHTNLPHYSSAVIRAAYHAVAVAGDQSCQDNYHNDGQVRPETRALMRRANDILTRACLTKADTKWLAFMAGRVAE